MSTAKKMQVARLLSAGVRAIRWAVGRSSDAVRCQRLGLSWELDLSEGVQLACFLGVYERATRLTLLRLCRPGAVAIDIGANIGALALPMARAVGPGGTVVAVEPTDSAFGRLSRQIELNPGLDATVVPVHRALGKDGELSRGEYYSAWTLGDEGAGVRHAVHEGVLLEASGGMTTLDNLVDELGLSAVDLIKLDVDGDELAVLSGSERTLRRYRPTVMFEFCPYLAEERGEQTSALLDRFDELGFEIRDETLSPAGPTATLLARVPDGGALNLVALPRPIERRTATRSYSGQFPP